MTESLHTVAQRCVQISEAHGFDRCTWENLPLKLMFVVSEIDETCEAMEKLEGFSNVEVGEELADIAIRTMVMIETLWPDWPASRIVQRSLRVSNGFQTPEKMLWPMIRCARQALHYWRMENQKDAQICLEFLLLELWRLGDRLRIDLDGFIQLKADKNEGRPMRNGKVRSEG